MARSRLSFLGPRDRVARRILTDSYVARARLIGSDLVAIRRWGQLQRVQPSRRRIRPEMGRGKEAAAEAKRD